MLLGLLIVVTALRATSSGTDWLMALCVMWVSLVVFCAVGLGLARNEAPFTGGWVVWSGVAFYGLLILGFWAIGRKDVLWVADSHSLHVPGVEKAIAFLEGDGRLEFSSIFENQFQISHIWAAFLGVIAGVDPVATACTNLFLKVLTWVIWWRLIEKHFGALVAAISLMFLIFIPTQIFYGLVFYKEPMVQLLVVIALWSSIGVLSTGSKYVFLMGLGAVMLLAIERIYLAPMLGVALMLSLIPNAKRLVLSFTSLMLAGTVVIATVLFGFIFFRDFSLIKIFDNLAWVRHNYMNAPGVDKSWNQDIPYALALVKILFTPFFHPNKLDVFKEFSAFITWGAIPSQIVTAIAVLGVWFEVQKERLRTLVLVVPFLLFLLLFAYLAPYSGRQRDSFYPVISLFAAIGASRLANKLHSAEKKSRH